MKGKSFFWTADYPDKGGFCRTVVKANGAVPFWPSHIFGGPSPLAFPPVECPLVISGWRLTVARQ